MAKWTREQVFQLIDVIKDRPALYDIKHPSYKLKHIRLKLLNECREELQSIRFNTSVEDVKKKWSAIRQTYISEKRKVEYSMRNGSGSDMIYTPSLFYFNEMRFLEDSIDALASVSTDNSQEANSPSHDFLTLPEETYLNSPQERLLREEIGRASSEPPPSCESPPSSLGHPTCESPPFSLSQPSRKRKRDDSMEGLAQIVSEALQTTTRSLVAFSTIQMNAANVWQEDKVDRYIKTVGDRLRDYEEPERSLIQAEIDEVFARHLKERIAASKSN